MTVFGLLRALHVLHLVDTVACEDTRHSQALLRAFGIDHPSGAWLAVHQHNESAGSEAVIARLRQGQRVAFVSDAGTPAISDPGARLVARVQAGARMGEVAALLAMPPPVSARVGRPQGRLTTPISVQSTPSLIPVPRALAQASLAAKRLA